ncbi:amino acid adenylation domain-containing protein [Ningiella sp. W23]|uniref:amino acid adenylation domain-containing protein n=1 Tax=Ningiella sp. W23 TaxID=3023715 RepID=UPI003756E834
MSIQQLLKTLRNSGVKIKLSEQNLVCQLPENGIDDDLKDSLISRKEEIKAYLQQNNTGLLSQVVKSNRSSIDENSGVPLSFNQQILWTDQQVHGTRNAFHMPFAFKLKGSLSKNALQEALNQLIQRHEILRTVYRANENGVAQQYIKAQSKITLNDIDLTNHQDKEKTLIDLLKADIQTPFDLSKDSIIRATLFALGDKEYVFLITLHHIASDGWSMGILLQELTQIYNGIVEGNPQVLPELSLQYSDYAIWQKNWFNSEEGTRSIEYWKSQLDNLPTIHGLTLDYQRPETQTFNGLTYKSIIKNTEMRALKQLCQQEGVTLFMGLHAIISIMLARFSGENDIVVGASVANRNQPELAGLIGFFVNMLVLRSSIDEGQTFRQFLHQSKEVLNEAYTHQQVPIAKLLETLKPVRSLSHNPLFQIVMVLQNNDQSEVNFTDLEVEAMSPDQEGSKYDLTLGMLDTDDGLVLNWEYNNDLFAESSIQKMAEYTMHLVESFMLKPDSPISEINCVDKTNIEQLKHWQGEASHESGDVWQAFEAVVKSQPDGIAVREGERQVSYQALAERVAQWSSVLQAEGVSSGEAVGVLLERGVDAITAILAIVRCGARYVPLDKGYPDTRIASMLSTAGVSVVLTDGSEHEGMKGARSLALQDIDKRRCAPCEAVSRSGVSGLYVMYTSGSTGTPKGVQVPDGAVLRLCRQPTLSLSAQDTLLLQAPLVFDASTLELWGALLNGATVAIGQGGAMSVPRLAQDIEQYGVSVLWLTASLFHVVMDEQPDALSGLRCLIAGGDTLSGRHVSEYLGADASRKLVNGYGPTEATTFSCLYAMNTHDAHQDVPIGYPLAQSSCYVLNDAAQRVPLGVPGELYVGGAGLADGYLGESVKTALAFVPNPYGPAGSRMYRTGDRVRYNAAGALEFLGRQDAQVKIRGYRIELGEISHALDSYEGLVHALVWVDEEGGHKRLMAAVSGEVDAVEVQGYLRDSLPDYMQPHRVHVLSQMPLTINGKIDKAQVMRMLAAQDKESQGESAAQPASELEARLIAIWEDVLQVDSVSRHDSFFELGGDSILSIQLAARAAADDIHFSLEDLFEHDTVAALAKAIGQEQTTDTHHQQTQAFELIDKELAAQLPNEIEDAYPVSQLQQGMLYHSFLGEGKGIYHDIIHYRIGLPFARDAFFQTINILTERHAVLRTGIDLESYACPLQLVHKALSPTIEIYENEDDLKNTLDRWQEKELALSFEKNSKSLIRFAAFTSSEDEFYFGLSFHHAILDGWSEASLTAEFLTTYEKILKKEWQAQTELNLTYRDFIKHELEAINDKSQADAWTALRDIELSRVKLPDAGPERENEAVSESQSSLAVSSAISGDESKALRDLAKEFGCSLKTIMLSIHLKTLALASNQTNVVSGVSFHGRPELLDSEKVLGLFVNILPLAVNTEQGSWKSLVCAVELAYKEIMQRRFYPLAQIKRDLDGHALFDVSFNYTQFNVLWQDDSEAGTQLNNQRGGIAENSLPFSVNVQSYPDRDDIYFSVTTLKEHYPAGVGLSYSRLYRQVLSQMLQHTQSAHDNVVSESDLASLRQWNDTGAPLVQWCLHELFEGQVRARPQAIAVTYGQTSLTYAQVNAQANQLARYLQAQRQVSAETLVGVCLPRSFQLLVAILAVLKAGGAYVPLDPTYPTERLSMMQKDADLHTIVTSHELDSQSWLSSAEQVVIDSEQVQSALAEQSMDDLRLPCKPEQLAYVMYTSGSTGMPKGVMVEHRNVASLVCDVHHIDLTTQTKTLLHSPICFDAATFEIWAAWLNGGCIAVHQGNSADVEALASSIKCFGVSTLWMTSGLFDVFSELVQYPLPALQQLLVGGDVVNPQAVRAVQKRNPQLQCFNGYGPTENTTFSTLYRIPDEISDTTALPIGQPLDNRQCYVLNTHLQALPIGVTGELYVGGAGVARAYLNREDLTEQRFIDNPFYDPAQTGSSRKLYRTGDLVRWQADGQLYYLGRNDFQVKLRGFRIELGDIENALLKQEGVKEALVLAQESPAGKHLVAYYRAKERFNSDVLRQRLSQQLPDYMLPQYLINVAQFPLTANGKIDRSALPAPQLQETQAYEAPQGQTEQALADIWKELLGIERVSRHDNFFMLGGHSLLVTRLNHKFRSAFDIEIPLSTLIAASDLKAQSTLVEHYSILANNQSLISDADKVEELSW